LNALVPLPVILPLLGAGLNLMLTRRPGPQRVVSTTVLTAVVAIAAVLVYQSDRDGPQVVWIGLGPNHWGSPWSPTGCRR